MRITAAFAIIALGMYSKAWAQDPEMEEADPEHLAGEGQAQPHEGDPLARFPWKREGAGELGSRAKLTIPPGYAFLEGDAAADLLTEMGNITSGDELGLIGPSDLSWFVVFFFDEIGYVKDDDKGGLDPHKMLESIRQQIEASNKIRQERGLPIYTLEGWAIPPRYNEETHVLEWAERFLVEGHPSVNFKTRVLGRKGVIRVILATEPEFLDAALPQYRTMMKDFQFIDGERYDQFVAGDKIAEYGLVALVAGGAGVVAAKTGLLTGLLVLAKKGWKLLLVGIAAIGAFIKRLFGSQRIKDEPEE